MDGRQLSSSSLNSHGSSIDGFSVRPPDEFNFDISDLLDDFIALAYAESASSFPDAGSGMIISNIAQRIASLRTSVQEAKELCRSSSGTQQNASSTTVSAAAATASTPRTKLTSATANAVDVNQSLSLFQSACDLDPTSQQRLLSAVATACVAKRNLLAELNQELLVLKMQNDHFSI